MILHNAFKLASKLAGASALALALSATLAVAQSDGNDRTPGGVEHAPSAGGGLAPADEMTTRGMPDLSAPPEPPAAAAPAAAAPSAEPAPPPVEAPSADTEPKKKSE